MVSSVRSATLGQKRGAVNSQASPPRHPGALIQTGLVQINPCDAFIYHRKGFASSPLLMMQLFILLVILGCVTCVLQVMSWKVKLPLQTIMRLLQVLVPQVEKICIDKYVFVLFFYNFFAVPSCLEQNFGCHLFL